MTVEERMDNLENMTYANHKYASRGQGNAGVALGSVGTALGGLNLLGGLGALFNGGIGIGPRAGAPIANGTCNEDHLVSRYDLDMVQKIQNKDAEIAALNTDIKLRDANTYSDQKNLELYKYVDGRFREFEAALASQGIQNQANKDSFQILQERLDCAKKECECAINAETRARKCADDIIVNYTNATFYPKMVADITTGTTTTAQSVYNPLPACSCKSC